MPPDRRRQRTGDAAVTKTPYDVLGLGCVTVDDFLFVTTFPGPDDKTRVLRSERQCGGLAGTALVAAARLGARCAFAGLLGVDDTLSQIVAANFAREGVDIAPAVRRTDARPIHSTIIVGSGGATRNIFFEVAGRVGADDDLPDAATIRAARVLFVDHYGIAGNLRAIRIAREAGIPVVADLERDEDPRFPELLAAVDHPVLSEKFALRVTGAVDAAEAVRRLWRPDRQAVVVTGGEAGCWYTDDGAAIHHQPAFPVEVVDTTGCGDVFHGAYAAALARGETLAARVRFASAAAALKATQPGGQRGIPDRAAVETFLKERA
jgi:sugar/nucleoside kinase (ribokinase family)